ncbi:hypothetical protein ES288_D12G082600v1 [Gossypium darwinii]|uniref:Uncharacterized protein n=1 Tax=Gossypium darwinii TaxID=34276 RepID=A0A5D2A895_GOSDA|nr:hypothetical protein ES288_D12G082600v1 [Gossypium darwinii]
MSLLGIFLVFLYVLCYFMSQFQFQFHFLFWSLTFSNPFRYYLHLHNHLLQSIKHPFYFFWLKNVLWRKESIKISLSLLIIAPHYVFFFFLFMLNGSNDHSLTLPHLH